MAGKQRKHRVSPKPPPRSRTARSKPRTVSSKTAHTARRRNEEQLLGVYAALAMVMEGIAKLDGEGRHVFVNPPYAALMGYAPEELIGQPWDITVHPDDRAIVVTALALLPTTGKAELELRGFRKDGTLMFTHLVIVRSNEPDERPSGHFCLVRDLTERKQEEALQAAERTALELVAKGAALTDVLVFICQAVEAHTAPMLCSMMLVTEDGAHLSLSAGPSLPESYRREISRIPIGPTVGSCGSAAHFRKPAIVEDIATDPLWKDYVSVALSHGLQACWSLPILSSTDRLLGTLAVYHSEPRKPQPSELKILGRVSQIVAIAVEHARMTEALQESEARFQAFMRHSPVITFIKDEAGRHLYVNPQFETLLGRSGSEILGKTAFDFLPSDLAAKIRDNDQVVFSSGKVCKVEGIVPDSSGTAKPWLVIKFPLEIGHRRLLGGVAVDITERKQAEESLLRTQFAMDQAVDAVYWIDPQARILYTNEAASVMLGYTADEFRRMTVHDLNPEFPREVWPAFWERTREQKVISLETVHLTRDGRRIPIEIRVGFLAHDGQEFHCAFVRDISKRKRAEESLLRTRFAMDQAVDAVYWIDPQAKILYTNEAASIMLGYSKEEFLRMTVHDLNPDFPAEVWPGWWEEVKEKKVVSLETGHRTKDGRRIPIDLRVAFLAHGGQEFHCAFVRDISKRKEAEESAYRSLTLLQSVLHTTPICVFWKDRESRFLGCNQNFAVDAGCKDACEIVGKTDADLAWREQAAKYQADDRLVMESGCAKLDFEEPGTTRDGEPVWLRTSKVPLRDEQRQVIGVLGVYEDITERKRVDGALRASQERFELAVRASNDGIWDWNILTGDQYWSDRHFELFGLEPKTFVPTYDRWIALVHPDDAGVVDQATRRHLDTREPYDIELRVRMKDGSYRWFRDRGQAVWDELGRPIRMVGSISDVTARRLAEEAIWKANAELEQRVLERTKELATANRALELEIVERKRVEGRLERTQYAVDHAGDQIFVIDSKGFFLDVNESACRRLGYTKEELLTMSVMDIDPDFPPEAWDACWAAVTREGQLRLETRHRSKSGEIYPVEVVANYLVHNGQELDCAIVRDVTERKRIEDRLQRTQYAVDHAADQIFVIGSNGYFLDVNESACRRLGYTKEELLTLSVMDIDSDCPPDLWLKVWAEFIEKKGMRLDRQHRSKTGEVYPVEVLANYIHHQGQALSYAIVRDVSERRRAEEAMRESELRYKLVTEATFDAIALHDNGVLLEVNTGLERMFGYEPGELIGRSILDIVADESRDQIIRNMQNGVAGPYEAIGRRKDGATFAGEVVVRPYWYRGKEVRLVAGRDISLRKQLEQQLARYAEGLERQVVERTAEIAKLESQRAQVEKLAAVGQLAAAVAHEINNPIAGIRNAFTLVKQAVDPAHPHHEFAGMIDREITRVATIVQNMYQLYRKEPSKTEVIELQPLLSDLEAVFAKQISQRGIRFVKTLPTHPVILQVPQSDLLQVLMNLVQNAIDSSHQGGTITLDVTHDESMVTIAVSDEGSGIAPDVLPHIFDPFFTTKTEKNQKGMGLGLSVSHSMVMAMGGRIEVQTRMNVGSTFAVVLPQAAIGDAHIAKQSIIKEVLSHDG